MRVYTPYSMGMNTMTPTTCTRESHRLAVLDPEQWARFAPIGSQTYYDDEYGRVVVLEQANCNHCGSTLARERGRRV